MMSLAENNATIGQLDNEKMPVIQRLRDMIAEALADETIFPRSGVSAVRGGEE